MHLTDTNYKNYYPLEALCSEGLISRITIVGMGELEVHIDDIQRHFDETVSIEAMVGDYLAAYKEVGSNVQTISTHIIDDYDSGGLFISLTAEHKDSVEQSIRLVFQLIQELFKENQVDLDEVPEWELVGMRGWSHVVLAQAKTSLTPQELARLAPIQTKEVDNASFKPAAESA